MSDLLHTGRRETIRRAASQLADSGAFPDWQSIAVALYRRYGVLAVRHMLVDRTVRAELNRCCTTAISRLAREAPEVSLRRELPTNEEN